MHNTQLVSKMLKEKQEYPDSDEKYGIKVEMLETGELLIEGDAHSLIDLADLLVSLSQSEANKGYHWHVGVDTILEEESKISDIVIQRR